MHMSGHCYSTLSYCFSQTGKCYDNSDLPVQAWVNKQFKHNNFRLPDSGEEKFSMLRK